MWVPEDDPYREIFLRLKHPIRRRILSILSDGPKSFSDLQKEFKIKSSHMSYHLDGLGDLLCTTKDGKYALSHLGEAAFSLMKNVEGLRVTPSSRPVVVKKNPRKHFKLGGFSVPLWPFVMLVVLMLSSVGLGYYFYSTTFTVSLEINEPIEIIGYPSQWSVYPGESVQFNVTVNNHAPLNYSVVLDFSANDSAYQEQYITFSDETYTVVPGQQNLEAWFNVTPDAPPVDLNVTVSVLRVSGGSNLLVNGGFETGTFSGWDVVGVCSISNTIVHSGSYSAYVSDAAYDSWITQEVNLPADDNYYFNGWVYPLNVGSLGQAFNAWSAIFFWYYNKSTMLPAFHVSYEWCWNDYQVTNGNSSTALGFLLPFAQSGWNLLSRNLTEDVRSYFAGIDLSQFVLYSIGAQYHYSNGSPGPFYVDDLKLSTS